LTPKIGRAAENSPAYDQPYSFTGREYDVETGLHYYRARYLDPNSGRFISKDPLGFEAGDPVLYGYVGNNSVFPLMGD